MGPFPESVQNVITDLRATFEKRDRETIANPSPASTTTTATIPAPANTATPAIYETATTATTPAHTDTAAPTTISKTAATPVQVNRALDVRHITTVPARSEVELTTNTKATEESRGAREESRGMR